MWESKLYKINGRLICPLETEWRGQSLEFESVQSYEYCTQDETGKLIPSVNLTYKLVQNWFIKDALNAAQPLAGSDLLDALRSLGAYELGKLIPAFPGDKCDVGIWCVPLGCDGRFGLTLYVRMQDGEPAFATLDIATARLGY